MLTLGIETSCDESALALVENSSVRGQTLHSQIDVHALFGGVVPELASREHGRLFPTLYDSLLATTGVCPQDIDCIAVTRGPGLLGGLLVGCAFAKSLAWALHKPLLAINHLHAHLLVAGVEYNVQYPALGLLVSGGHTHIYRIDAPNAFTQLGTSVDDAAGEVIDKFGKSAGLPYPAGKFVDEFGHLGLVDHVLFPRPYIHNTHCDFSFSGLKTTGAQLLEENPTLRFVRDRTQTPQWTGDTEKDTCLANLCASYVDAVAETLRIKCDRALKQGADTEWKCIIVAGGVAANSRVRLKMHALGQAWNLPLFVPSKTLCTDNAVMVAYAGEQLYTLGYRSELDFSVIPRGQQVPWDYTQEAIYD